MCRVNHRAHPMRTYIYIYTKLIHTTLNLYIYKNTYIQTQHFIYIYLTYTIENLRCSIIHIYTYIVRIYTCQVGALSAHCYSVPNVYLSYPFKHVGRSSSPFFFLYFWLENGRLSFVSTFIVGYINNWLYIRSIIKMYLQSVYVLVYVYVCSDLPLLGRPKLAFAPPSKRKGAYIWYINMQGYTQTHCFIDT